MADRPESDGSPEPDSARGIDRDEPVTVTLERPDGRETVLDVHPGETVVEATERVDEGIPFGCLTGACGTCTGRLVAADRGEVAGDEPRTESGPPAVHHVVRYRRPPRALKDRHERDGYVLLCVAEPLVPCRFEVGASIQAELVENPWRSTSTDS